MAMGCDAGGCGCGMRRVRSHKATLGLTRLVPVVRVRFLPVLQVYTFEVAGSGCAAAGLVRSEKNAQTVGNTHNGVLLDCAKGK